MSVGLEGTGRGRRVLTVSGCVAETKAVECKNIWVIINE